MILADHKIDGKARKVILHAPTNGFFFVIDRTNGQFISAENFVEVNWASRYVAKGRPIEAAIARVADRQSGNFLFKGPGTRNRTRACPTSPAAQSR